MNLFLCGHDLLRALGLRVVRSGYLAPEFRRKLRSLTNGRKDVFSYPSELKVDCH